MKLGVFTVCTPQFNVEEAIAQIAAAGFNGIEWRITEDHGNRNQPQFWSGNRTSMTAQELKSRAQDLLARCAEYGLSMPSLGTYLDEDQRDQIESCLEAALAIGATAIRVKPAAYPPPDRQRYQNLLQASRAKFAGLAELAERYGVRILIETHPGHIAPSVSKARQILEGLDPKHVGIMWDPSNQVAEGLETYRMAIDIAGEYLAEVHVKNQRYVSEKREDGSIHWHTLPCPLPEGVVNWKKVFEELHHAGYTGWLMLEDFCEELPLDRRLTFDATYLRGLLADVQSASKN